MQLSTGGGGEQGVQRHAGGVHALGGGGEGQARARDTCFQVTAKSKSKRERRTNAWGANESSRVVQWQLASRWLAFQWNFLVWTNWDCFGFWWKIQPLVLYTNFWAPMFGHQVGPGQSRTVSKSSAVWLRGTEDCDDCHQVEEPHSSLYHLNRSNTLHLNSQDGTYLRSILEPFRWLLQLFEAEAENPQFAFSPFSACTVRSSGRWPPWYLLCIQTMVIFQDRLFFNAWI